MSTMNVDNGGIVIRDGHYCIRADIQYAVVNICDRGEKKDRPTSEYLYENKKKKK